jgi:hypothetical protein
MTADLYWTLFVFALFVVLLSLIVDVTIKNIQHWRRVKRKRRESMWYCKRCGRRGIPDYCERGPCPMDLRPYSPRDTEATQKMGWDRLARDVAANVRKEKRREQQEIFDQMLREVAEHQPVIKFKIEGRYPPYSIPYLPWQPPYDWGTVSYYLGDQLWRWNDATEEWEIQ